MTLFIATIRNLIDIVMTIIDTIAVAITVIINKHITVAIDIAIITTTIIAVHNSHFIQYLFYFIYNKFLSHIECSCKLSKLKTVYSLYALSCLIYLLWRCICDIDDVSRSV